MPRRGAYLLILAEREAIAWVLKHQRMAFPSRRATEASALRPGDALLLYTTRSAFHNPTRDRGRIIAEATVADEVRELPKPVGIAGRTYTHGCRLQLDRAAPPHEGLELAPLVPRLHAFPDPTTWSVRLRRTLMTIDDHDADLVRGALEGRLCPLEEVLGQYVKAARKAA
jgi:hypothetical protein